MIKNNILTKKAQQLIQKRLAGMKLTQQDSNYLSRFVRPKLRAMASIDAENLLRKLEYSRKSRAIEEKIKKIILKNVLKVRAIVVCGSAIQTNYKEYNDLDLIVATNNILKNNQKINIAEKIKNLGKKENLNLDVQIYARGSIIAQYPNSPSLIYQLKDSKIIYGSLPIPKKISLSALDLKMKLDWSHGLDMRSEANEIYYALRNSILVLLLMNKNISNEQLQQNMISLLGYKLFNNLKNNTASEIEIKLALSFLNLLNNYMEEELKNPEWEKIELENP